MEEQLKLIVAKAITGSAVDWKMAIRQLEELKGSLSKEDASDLESDFEAMMTDAVEARSGGTLSEEQRKAIKGAVASNMTLGTLKAGAGIFQIVDASLKKKNLDAPDFPELQAKNTRLSNRIADAQVRAEQGDPAIRAQFEKDMAFLESLYNERAKSSGNAGQYLSNVQGNALRQERKLGQFAAEEANRRGRYRGELDSLIGMDIRENNRLHNEKWRQFDVLNNRYERSLANLNAQSNSGVENLFVGLDQLAAGGRVLPFLERQKQADPVTFGDLGASSLQSLPTPELKPLSLGTISRLGSPSFRRDNMEDLLTFQKLGGVVGNGMWDDDTDSLFDEITTF